MDNRPLLFILLSILLAFSSCVDTSESPVGPDLEGPESDESESQELDITGIQPEEGPVGLTISISGSGFSSTASENSISFGGTDAEVKEATESEIKAIVPASAESGPVEITVDGESATGPTFTVIADAPAIEKVEPDSGSADTEVTITGMNFGDDPHAVEVLFNGVSSTVSEVSDTELITVVPNAAETGPLEVIVNGETLTGPTFTVIEPKVTEYSVEGKVIDSGSGMGLEGVEITFSSDTQSVYTDTDGSWTAEGLEGPVAVTAKKDGRDFPIRTRLVLGNEDEVNFTAYQNYEAPRDTRIAYQYRYNCSGGTGCDKPYSIWTMDSNGFNKEILTDSTGSDRNPTWSPNASKIAFDSDREGDEPRIWIMNADSSGHFNTGVKGSQPAWSPGGDQIAYVYDGDIRVMDLNGNYSEIYSSGNGYASAPAWSPEGSKIAFVANRGGGERHIWVMQADGNHLTQLTRQYSPARNPAWEPSGGRILYDTGNITWKDSILRLVNVDGTNDHTNEEWPDHGLSQATWSPGGEELAYVYRSMIPIYNRIHWVPIDNNAWMDIAGEDPNPDDDLHEFWAESPAWAPK